jgi:hypothetical protein
MLIKNTIRLEKPDDDAIEKIKIKENIKKSVAINRIIKLGLEEYYKQKIDSGNTKIDPGVSPKFDELHEKIQALSDQIKDVDLKSYRMNIFVSDFAKAMINDAEKFSALYDGVVKQFEAYKIQLKHTPKLGFVVLKYIKNILAKNIPDQFYSDVEKIYWAIIEGK